MCLTICASTLDFFSRIEMAVNLINSDFISKFDTAEFEAEGYSDVITITSKYFIYEEIVLPQGFSIIEIKNSSYFKYKKDSEENIKEEEKYQIEILCTFQNQSYKLILKELNKKNFMNFNICILLN